MLYVLSDMQRQLGIIGIFKQHFENCFVAVAWGKAAVWFYLF